MIYLRHYTKSKENFLIEENKQDSMEFGCKVAEEATLLGWHESYAKSLIWFAYRKSEKVIRIVVMDNNENLTTHIDLEDDFLDSEVTFVSLPDEHRIIVSLTAGQDGSQDYCLAFLKNKLTITRKFPKNLTYTFGIDEEDSLMVNFLTDEFYKISNQDFQIKISQSYSVFENDALSNVWRISDSFGIFCTTEERWYVFKLNTLELVDQLTIEDNIDTSHGDYCGMNTLYQTGNELIFRCYDYKNGKEEIDWIHVDKIYLNKLIEDWLKDKENQNYQ